ncbi:MAG: hypothetical protein IPK60_01000 [Sandaracinaceae bacterium]|nr:hypothetical protein [Sandaracinaceae bacterium]
MEHKIQSLSPNTEAPPKRHLKNYLLDPAFQLKYTGMVVLVTVVVASILGFFTYRFSVGQTQSLTMTLVSNTSDLDPAALRSIEADAARADREVLFKIIGGIGVLVLSLGLAGIYITHKMVGPAYKLRLLLKEVRQGHLTVGGRLRKGDELQDVFLAFERMVISLRKRQQEEVDQLTAVIDRARKADAPKDVIDDLQAVRDRMLSQLT